MTALLHDTFAGLLAREAAAETENAASDGFTLELAADMAAFDALEPEWEDLFARSAASHQLFQSFAWNRVWARHYIECGPGGEKLSPAVITGRRNGRLVLVWPLVVWRASGLRHVTWMGEPASQYGDVLVERGPATEAELRRSWRYALDRLSPDVVTLRKVREDASVLPLMSAIGAHRTACHAAPYLDLECAASFRAYEQRYSTKARKNRRRLMRRLVEKGTIGFVHVGHGPEAAKLTAKALELKRAWLDDRNVVASALRDNRILALFEEFVSVPRRGAAARVFALTRDGQPIAIMVAICHAGRLAGHVFAYDVRGEASGAGVLLLEDIVRHAFRERFSVLDLMAPADAYKLDWADAAVPVCDWAVALSLEGRIYRRLYLELMKEPLKRLAGALPKRLRRWLSPV